jgi:ectoine hydroxylase-related dioxygenase (phytanoyl-CoA dioxygenase family)
MPSLLTKQQRDFLMDNGYLVVKRGLPHDHLDRAKEGAMRIVQKCAKGDYAYCRSDSRLSDRFIEKIDHIFHPDIFEPDIFKAVVHSQILDYAKEALGEDDVFVSFFRMHPTLKYSSWSSWHRDDEADGNHEHTIKATLPLFAECGFHVIPGSHKQGDKTLDGTESEIKGHLPREVRVIVGAGDILLFHTAIVHRASCAGRGKYRRAQIHFRVTATKHAHEGPRVQESRSTREEVLAIADKSWRHALCRQVQQTEFYPVTTRGEPTRGAHKLVKQLLARMFYYGSALLPEHHRWLSDPPAGFVPYVRVPKQLRSIFE